MSWFRRRKQRDPIDVDGVGRVEDDAGQWCTRQVELHQGFRADIGLGPSDQTPNVTGYRALLKTWPTLRKDLQEEAFELQSNYLEEQLPKGATAEGVWATMLEPVCRIVAAGNYELCVTFAWQNDDDPHTVTFYVEDGVARGCSIDG